MKNLDWKAGFRRAAIFVVLYAVILYAMSELFPQTFGVREGQLQTILIQGVFFFLVLSAFFAWSEPRRKQRMADLKARREGKQPKQQRDENAEPSAFKGRQNPNTSRKKARRRR